MRGKVASITPMQWSSFRVGLASIMPRVHGRAWGKCVIVLTGTWYKIKLFHDFTCAMRSMSVSPFLLPMSHQKLMPALSVLPVSCRRSLR